MFFRKTLDAFREMAFAASRHADLVEKQTKYIKDMSDASIEASDSLIELNSALAMKAQLEAEVVEEELKILKSKTKKK